APEHRGRRRRHGPADAARPARGRPRGPGRSGERGREAAHHLRRGVRPGGGDRRGCRVEGEPAGAQVPPRRVRGMTTLTGMLTVLAVDDEPPALDELAFLLRRDPHVGEVRTAEDGAAALRELDAGDIDVIVLDIKMPGPTGLELARVLTRVRKAPDAVVVTAYDEHAVEAFDVGAADYVRKPFRPDRLADAVRRAHASLQAGAGEVADETIVVELAGVTRYVRRSDVLHVTAHGDY